MPVSWLFNLIGKLFVPRQPEWERRRGARIFLSVVTVSLLAGIFLWKVMIYINRK